MNRYKLLAQSLDKHASNTKNTVQIHEIPAFVPFQNSCTGKATSCKLQHRLFPPRPISTHIDTYLRCYQSSLVPIHRMIYRRLSRPAIMTKCTITIYTSPIESITISTTVITISRTSNVIPVLVVAETVMTVCMITVHASPVISVAVSITSITYSRPLISLPVVVITIVVPRDITLGWCWRWHRRNCGSGRLSCDSDWCLCLSSLQ